MSSLLLLVAFQLIESAPPPPPPTGDGVIEVVVTNSATREPVRKANVSIFGPVQGANLRTDASGKVVFEHLPDGEFTVQADHPNFPAPRHTGAWRDVAELKQGERKRQVSIKMNPAAAVSGRVVDEDGDPLSPCNVQVMRRDPMNRGRVGNFGSAQTKPTGEYRIFNVNAGRYYVVATCQKQTFAPHPLSDEPPRNTARYEPVVYPGASDFASATMLELAPGSERSGIDFRLTEGAVGRVVVKVFPPDTPPGGQLQVMLVSRDPFLQALQGTLGAGFNQKLGAYVFDSMPAGTYDVQASAFLPGKAYGGRTSIDVETGKVTEVSIPLGSGTDVTGRIDVEDGSNLNLTTAQVFLQPADDNPMPANQQPGKVDESGSFTLTGVMPGKYRLRVYGLPNEGYVKSVSLPDREVTGGLLDYTAAVAGPIRVVAGTKTASVEGNLTGDVRPGVVSQVFLLRDSDESGEIRNGSVQNSRFQFTGIPPGKYHLLAIGRLSMGMSPATADALSAFSKEVELEEGATVTVDVPVISNEQMQKALAAAE